MNYLDKHVGEDAKNHVNVRLRVRVLWRPLDKELCCVYSVNKSEQTNKPLNKEGATGCKGEGEGAEDNAHHLGHCWSAC